VDFPTVGFKSFAIEWVKLEIVANEAPARRHRSLASNVADIQANGRGLRPEIDKQNIERLIGELEARVKRRIDMSFPMNLRKELLVAAQPELSLSTIRQLARWCKTDGIYGDGMIVAQKISLALFGVVLDRTKLGT